MTKKDNNALVKKFQKIEQELIEVLKIKPIQFDEKTSSTEVKKEINGYIKKIKKVKTLFEQYEQVAEQIKKAGKTEDEVLHEVIDLREEPEKHEIATAYATQEDAEKILKEEYENVVQVDVGGTRVERKKKSEKKVSKEL